MCDIQFPNPWYDPAPLPLPAPWPNPVAPAPFLPGFVGTTTLKPFTGWLTDADVERLVSAVVKRLVEMHVTPPAPKTETAWVIEDQRPALSTLHRSVTMFWAGWDESSNPPRLPRWTDDPSRAIRFARKHDADVAVMGLGKGVASERTWITP
jgi:hypothetical protein